MISTVGQFLALLYQVARGCFEGNGMEYHRNGVFFEKKSTAKKLSDLTSYRSWNFTEGMTLKLMLNLLIWLRKNLEWGFQSYSTNIIAVYGSHTFWQEYRVNPYLSFILYEGHSRKQETEKLFIVH